MRKAEARRIADHIAGLGRFELVRELGAGGMGVVFEAHDHERDARVALKALWRVDPSSIYRFKREFRALSDVTHRNLVTLYELVGDDGEWYFSMELLKGVNLSSYLRRPQPDGAGDDASRGESSNKDTVLVGHSVGVDDDSSGGDTVLTGVLLPAGNTLLAPPQPRPPADPARIRPVMRQLAEAIGALHSTGHLHRDIKPSNVLVTHEGRVVVLDYGIITELGGAEHGRFQGTPAYAAPEQADPSARPTPASDWYGVGIILYEALTGRRPFYGTGQEVLDAKRDIDPPAPNEIYGDADPALSELCVALLRRNPEDRPDAAEVVRALEDVEQERSGSRRRVLLPTDRAIALVGRARELAVLREAFAQTRQGAGCAIRLTGRSGMGKTSLIECLLSELSEQEGALVLTGRCYERESVPHATIDGLVDSLCRFLLTLPPDEVAEVIPEDVYALACAFPVLGRVEAVVAGRRRARRGVLDPVELRRRAFCALCDLFGRIAARRPLVLFIDDLQWGDVDSSPFLSQLMEPPVPPLLLLLSYRREERESSPILTTLLDPNAARVSPLVSSREISVDRLPLPQALRLAQALLEAAEAPLDTADKIAEEAGGNPYFVHELVRFVASSEGVGATWQPELSQVIMARVEALSADARRLLAILAVVGKPLPQLLARRAAGLDEGHPRAVSELRSAHMVRTAGSRSSDLIETFHDRIRETVYDQLEVADRQLLHLSVAHTLEGSRLADPEALAGHYAAAGEWGQATVHAVAAADKAASAFAFERAAVLYGLALDQLPAEEITERIALNRKLGEALVNAGRGVDAAEAFLRVAEVAEARTAQDMRVRAGSQLLRAGRIDAGVELLRPTLAAAGVDLSQSPARATVSLLWNRALIRLRGLEFRPRATDEVAPDLLAKIDSAKEATIGLSMVDTVRGAYAQTLHLRTALRHGDEFRAGRALSFEAGFLSVVGSPVRARVDRIFDKVLEISERVDEPYLVAIRHAHLALAEYQCGVWPEALEHARQGERVFRDGCGGSASWERSSSQQYAMWALYWLGEFPELATLVEHSLRDARERGDLYTTVTLNAGLPSFIGLVADDSAGTQARLEEAASQWTRHGYHLQHYFSGYGLAQCELYAGEPRAARERLVQQWRDMKSVFLHRISMVRAEMVLLRGRCALALATRDQDRSGLLREAGRFARKLAREPMLWCPAAAKLLQAGGACARGELDRAVQLASEAETGLRASHCYALAVAACRLRGELLGGDQGAALVASSDQWMVSKGVANPQRMARFFAPGVAEA